MSSANTRMSKLRKQRAYDMATDYGRHQYAVPYTHVSVREFRLLIRKAKKSVTPAFQRSR